MKDKTAPKGGNVATAELCLDDGASFVSEGTSKKVPLGIPSPPPEEGGPVPKTGGHFKATHHGDKEGFLRDVDSEYKVLSDLADKLVATRHGVPAGRLYLYTERAPCDSCRNVIEQFKQRFPLIEVEVDYDFTVNGEPI